MILTDIKPAKKASKAEYRVDERRCSNRFPLDVDVSYKLIRNREITSGSGKTVNIGSGGVLFTTEQRLPVGTKVEVAVNWPVLLDGNCRLKFVASGPVLRSDHRGAVVRIDRYDFYTRARSN
jgi:hypothetical protein